ncbi:MAG: asparagine synthase (glutamine-hydrolyzing) [Gammaproteobacteria bacterium]
MCGLAGVFGFERKRPVDQGMLQRMADLLAHRGPDDAGIWAAEGAGLAHRRLSILDLSPAGHQPMCTPDGQVWIAYNGECYNHLEFVAPLRAAGIELRSRTDTEILLALYQLHGPRFVERIDGMFAFAIVDLRERRLMLARDRLGIKPLYYHADPRRVAFASELKALLAVPGVPTVLDPAAFGEFLHLMSIPGDGSIFRDVRRLPAAHYLLAQEGGLSLHEYWRVPLSRAPVRTDVEAAAARFNAVFDAAVRSHMVSDVPVGVFLSGGVDSSAVAAAAARAGGCAPASFAVNFPGQAGYDEGPYARRVASHVGTQHVDFDVTPDLASVLPRVVWHADEPFAVSSSLALYLLAQRAREHVKVVLTGDGGDEVFGGYLWRHVDFPPRAAPGSAAGRVLCRALAPLARNRGSALARYARAALERLGCVQVTDERYLRSFTCLRDEEISALLQPDLARRVLRAWDGNVTQRYLDGAAGVSQLTRKLYADIKSTLVGEMLTKVDRMTMAFGLEARVPFLDRALVEWAFGLPDDLKVRAGEGKFVVKKALESRLPYDVLYRPKHGFNVPFGTWLQGPLREMANDLLGEARMKRRGLFRPAAVRRLLAGADSGAPAAANRVFVLMCMELWTQQYVDGRGAIAFD